MAIRVLAFAQNFDSGKVRFDVPDGPEWFALFMVGGMIGMALIHFLLCFWAYDDARRLLKQTRDSRAVVIAPWFWLLAVLVTGIAGLAVYWGIHRSTLNPRNAPVRES